MSGYLSKPRTPFKNLQKYSNTIDLESIAMHNIALLILHIHFNQKKQFNVALLLLLLIRQYT